jgi:nucleoid-associated protein YgaU
MAKSRYKNRRIFNNTEEQYEELFDERQVKSIRQYETPRMSNISLTLRKQLTEKQHPWSAGDKFWKLAAKHYKNPKYWWVIAWYNLKPTDAHCRVGDVIVVPHPINKVLKYYGY